MEQQVQNFVFNTQQIRVVTIDGNPWFIAADACKVLGMDVVKGTYRWLGGLDATEKMIFTHRISAGKGGNPTIISESGLYKLTMRSTKPQAKPFQDWVTKDVLPAIRKDGMYVMGEEKVVKGEMSAWGRRSTERIAKALNSMCGIRRGPPCSWLKCSTTCRS